MGIKITKTTFGGEFFGIIGIGSTQYIAYVFCSVYPWHGFYQDSSIGKWFMKRKNIYYRFEHNGWYMYNNERSILPAKKTVNYWSLEGSVRLLTGNGLDSDVLKNTAFWQKWN